MLQSVFKHIEKEPYYPIKGAGQLVTVKNYFHSVYLYAQNNKSVWTVGRWSCKRITDAFRCLISKPAAEVSYIQIFLVANYFFHNKYVTSEGAIPHYVLYYQQLLNARYQK